MPQASTERSTARVDLILGAARRSIATRGYAATSLARVADEAGMSKRMVLYYFDSREQLISELVLRLADEMVEIASGTLQEIGDPTQVIVVGFRRIWARLVEDPVLVAAYLSVATEAVADDGLRATIQHVRESYDALSAQLMETAIALGYEPQLDRAGFAVHVFAGFRGLLLELFENGPSPALDYAVTLFERGVAGAFASPADS